MVELAPVGTKTSPASFPLLAASTDDRKHASSTLAHSSNNEAIPGVPRERIPVLNRIGSRGFTVEALLEFLCFLLDRDRALDEIDGMRDAFRDFSYIPSQGHMPSMEWFNPEKSTTFDVAYKAVVPLSKYAKSAYQPIMMKGRLVYPKAIITHTWGNVFTHTVAACVADALKQQCYFCILPKLRTYERVKFLIQKLKNDGVADQTYWLCLICINQHLIACDTQGCDCGLLKVTDDNDPNCEIGHFHEMMRFLVSKHADFYQVVAFDKRGLVLTRVWVVAEINEVQQANLQQHIKFHVPMNVAGRGIRWRMAKIDVRKSQATMAKDKERILANIPDKDKYNRRLRAGLEFIVRDQNHRLFIWAVLAFMWHAITLVICGFVSHMLSYNRSEIMAAVLLVLTLLLTPFAWSTVKFIDVVGVIPKGDRPAREAIFEFEAVYDREIYEECIVELSYDASYVNKLTWNLLVYTGGESRNQLRMRAGFQGGGLLYMLCSIGYPALLSVGLLRRGYSAAGVVLIVFEVLPVCWGPLSPICALPSYMMLRTFQIWPSSLTGV